MDKYSSSYCLAKFVDATARSEAITRRAITRPISVCFLHVIHQNVGNIIIDYYVKPRLFLISLFYTTTLITPSRTTAFMVVDGRVVVVVVVVFFTYRTFGGNLLCRHFPTQAPHRHPEIVSATWGVSGQNRRHPDTSPTCRRHLQLSSWQELP